MKKLKEALGALVLVPIIVVGIGILLAWPVQLLWNGCIVGTIDGVAPLESIWHAWGVMILCGLLFKGSSVRKHDDE